MGTLTIPDLPEELFEELRLRAARHGRSAEAEARALLAGALKPAEADRSSSRIRDEASVRSLDAIMAPYRGQEGGIVDGFLAERRALWGED